MRRHVVQLCSRGRVVYSSTHLTAWGRRRQTDRWLRAIDVEPDLYVVAMARNGEVWTHSADAWMHEHPKGSR